MRDHKYLLILPPDSGGGSSKLSKRWPPSVQAASDTESVDSSSRSADTSPTASPLATGRRLATSSGDELETEHQPAQETGQRGGHSRDGEGTDRLSTEQTINTLGGQVIREGSKAVRNATDKEEVRSNAGAAGKHLIGRQRDMAGGGAVGPC